MQCRAVTPSASASVASSSSCGRWVVATISTRPHAARIAACSASTITTPAAASVQLRLQQHRRSSRGLVWPAHGRHADGAATTSTEQMERCQEEESSHGGMAVASVMAFSMLMTLAAEPALAAETGASNPLFDQLTANSLYVTLALFLMSVPGIWSQIKRAPKASKKRKTYEVDGPGRPGAMSLKDRAKQIVTYFKKYNYEVKEMGEVITFAGLYAADKGQAAALTFYTFASMASVALVLSLLVPQVGNWWYLLTLAAPAAYLYYFQRGERVEEVKVKMVTADNEQTTDIMIEGDIEEIERFRKELGLLEKGMVPVKGLLEV